MYVYFPTIVLIQIISGVNYHHTVQGFPTQFVTENRTLLCGGIRVIDVTTVPVLIQIVCKIYMKGMVIRGVLFTMSKSF